MATKKPSSLILVKTVRALSVDQDAARKLVGKMIKDARKTKGLTQEEACCLLCVSRVQLCNIEIGRSGISMESMILCVINLGISFTPKTFGVEP